MYAASFWTLNNQQVKPEMEINLAGMQDLPYYKVTPKETAKDAHLIAVGALANDAGAMPGD